MLETVLSIIIGVSVAILLALIFSFKTKGITRLLINAVAGVAALFVLHFFNIPGFNLNPLNAFISAFLGVPGLIVIYIISFL